MGYILKLINAVKQPKSSFSDCFWIFIRKIWREKDKNERKRYLFSAYSWLSRSNRDGI